MSFDTTLRRDTTSYVEVVATSTEKLPDLYNG